MIKVTISQNANRDTVIVDKNDTIRKCLEDNEVDYSKGVLSLDGAPLKAGDIDKTFEQHGITSRCFIACVVKTDNAARI